MKRHMTLALTTALTLLLLNTAISLLFRRILNGRDRQGLLALWTDQHCLRAAI
jgi:hypothetical protein